MPSSKRLHQVATAFPPFMLLLTLSATNAGCNRSAGAPPSETPPEGIQVTVTTVGSEPIARVVTAVGSLMPAEETTLGSKVEGRVAEVNVGIGDRVSPGKQVAKIDPADFEWAERQAFEGLREALAVLERTDSVKSDAPDEVPADFKVDSLSAVRRAAAQLEQARADAEFVVTAVDSAKARVASAEAELKNALDKWERIERLRKTNVVTEQELLDARTRHDTAKAALDSAAADLRSAQARVATARAAVAAAEAQVRATVSELQGKVATARRMWTSLQIARKNCCDAVIAAPALPPEFAGDLKHWVVAQKLTAVGEFRKLADPIVRLVATEVLKLQLRVPEQHLNDVRKGQAVELLTDATGSRAIIGTVSRIRPVVDASTRNFDVEVRVPNSDDALKPGVFARARIGVRTDADVITVPLRAIVTFAGVTKVFVLENGLARDRPVTLGDHIGDRVEIVAGVKKGETVITSGQRLLADKSPVVVKPAAK